MRADRGGGVHLEGAFRTGAVLGKLDFYKSALLDRQVAARPQASHTRLVFRNPHLCLTPDGPGTSSLADPDKLEGDSSEGNLSSRQRFTASQKVCFHAHRTPGRHRRHRHFGWTSLAGIG